MKYLCLIYHEDAARENLAPDSYEAVARDSFEYRTERRRRGHWIAASPVGSADAAMSVRDGSGTGRLRSPTVHTRRPRSSWPAST